MELGIRKIIGIGNFYITETVIFAWIISLAMIAFAFFSTRKLDKTPKGIQLYAEYFVEAIYNFVQNTMGKHNIKFAPYIGTLFIFLLLGNLLGLLGLRPITANVNTTFALATFTFLLIQYSAIKSRRFKGYIKNMSQPYIFMLPINIIGEISFPISLSFRLFGNITGGTIIMMLAYGGLEKLSELIFKKVPFLMIAIPLPLNLFFDIFEGLLQAFIFTMLTMVFIAHGIPEKNET